MTAQVSSPTRSLAHVLTHDHAAAPHISRCAGQPVDWSRRCGGARVDHRVHSGRRSHCTLGLRRHAQQLLPRGARSPSPFTLHPHLSPFTLHPSPFTLHPHSHPSPSPSPHSTFQTTCAVRYVTISGGASSWSSGRPTTGNSALVALEITISDSTAPLLCLPRVAISPRSHLVDASRGQAHRYLALAHATIPDAPAHFQRCLQDGLVDAGV